MEMESDVPENGEFICLFDFEGKLIYFPTDLPEKCGLQKRTPVKFIEFLNSAEHALYHQLESEVKNAGPGEEREILLERTRASSLKVNLRILPDTSGGGSRETFMARLKFKENNSWKYGAQIELLESIADMVWSVDHNFRLLASNQVFRERAAARGGKILKAGDSVILDTYPEEILREWKSYYARALEGEKHTVEIGVDIEDGKLYYEFTFNPIRDKNGEITGIAIHSIETTGRKKIEEALRESEERWQLALKGSRDGVWDWNILTGEDFFSRRWKEMLGHTEDEVPHHVDEFVKRVHPEDMDAVWAEVERYFKGETPVYQKEFRMLRKDGSYIWVLNRGVAVFDEENRPVRMLGTIVDITPQKLIEQALRQGEARFRAMNDASPLGVFVTDTEGGCIYTNQSYQRITGLTFDEAQGDGWIKGIHPEDQERVFMKWTEATETQNFHFALVYRFVHVLKESGEANIVWVSTRTAPMYDGGKLTGYVGTMEDITSRKHTEIELIEARDRAEAATRTKSEFLSNMSHEIRTPLNAIMGFSDLLLQDTLNKSQMDNVGAIKNASENLLAIINDILDFSRIEAGKVFFESIEFEPRTLVEQMIRLVEKLAARKNLVLHYRLDPRIPLVLVGDPIRFNQVLINLTNNAIKFTDEGRIDLDIRVRGGDLEEQDDAPFVSLDDLDPSGRAGGEIDTIDESVVTLVVSVSDTGIGIPEEKRSEIFNDFSQARSDIARVYGGSGLGLSICKQLLEKQGGRIKVESVVGRGSVFTFALPFQVSKRKSLSEKARTFFPEKDLSELRLLLVEDNIDNQLLACRLLKKWNVRVEVAENGREALEKLRVKEFDLVFMDLQMPIMSGIEATRKIRNKNSGVLNSGIPIIALTADAFPETRERVLEAGMDDFVSKPFKQKVLYQSLIRWGGKEAH